MDKDIKYIDYENLEKIVKMLEAQISEETTIIHNINASYLNLKENYISDNNNSLGQFFEQNVSNMKRNRKNHDSNVFLINKRIQNVKEKIRRVKEIDENAKINRVV